MAYKLIAIDLDDTLLDNDKRVSARDRQAIAHAKEMGVHVMLVSGRAFQGIERYNKQLEIEDYTVGLAGGQVVDKNGEVVFATNLPPVSAKQVMRWAALRNIHYQVYLEDGLHFSERTRCAEFYEQQCGTQGTVDPDLLEREPIITPKILFVDTPDKIEKYRPEVTQMFPELEVQISQPEYLEILNPDTSKADGLHYVIEKLGLVPEQVMAIGDSEIDESMLKYAGLGVAVENAVPSVLDIADYVTDSNLEDGVAKAIEKFVLNS